MAKIDKSIEALAIDQGLHSAAHHNVGRGLTIVAPSHTNRMLRPGWDTIADMGRKDDFLRLSIAAGLEIDCNEWGVFNPDSDFFDWRDKEIFTIFAFQYARKKPNKRRASDRCAVVEPGPVPPDFHIQVAAERWIPKMNGRKSA